MQWHTPRGVSRLERCSRAVRISATTSRLRGTPPTGSARGCTSRGPGGSGGGRWARREGPTTTSGVSENSAACGYAGRRCCCHVSRESQAWVVSSAPTFWRASAGRLLCHRVRAARSGHEWSHWSGRGRVPACGSSASWGAACMQLLEARLPFFPALQMGRVAYKQ